MARRVWLEAALNGPWARGRQPLIPLTVGEIVADGIACAREGAAIVHVHAYDEVTGRQRDDWEVYARIIEGIRNQVDVIVYPTIPLAGGPDAARPMSPRARFEAVEALARRGLIEWSIVDPGSVNFSHVDDLRAGRAGFVYLNPEEHVRHGLALAARHRFHPSYACYEPGFIRLGAALHRAVPGAPTPVYRVLFSQGFTFSFPPEDYALETYHRLLQDTAPEAPWMIGGLAVDVRGLIPQAMELGGHVRVGLEDAPHGCEVGNVWWMKEAERLIRWAGGEAADAGDVRRALAAARSAGSSLLRP